MAKEDILLRATANAPLTTKGSSITYAEADANLITIFNCLVSLSQSSYVLAYDNAQEYDDEFNNYVTYSNQIWKFISATPQTGVTPVEGAVWSKRYATDLAGRAAMDGIKRYKALISQNAPIASQTSGTFTVGMVVSITTFVAGDDFSNWTLISGTANTTGAVYQVTIAAPTTWTNGSTLAYDGRPYIVSTDSSGVLNPLSNTIGGTFAFAYATTGRFTFTHSALSFVKAKCKLSLDLKTKAFWTQQFDGTTAFQIYTYNSAGASENDLLNYSVIEIEVYP